jgi:hypothetical protein
MADDHFDTLILIARPASGKSEVIAHLKQTPEDERRQRYHIGPFREIDDFPMLWAWFEEDAILEEMGRPRLHTTPDEYFISSALWNLLIRRIGLEYGRLLRDDPAFHQRHTALIEFSRGAEHGGYFEAFQHLSDDLLSRAAVLYIEVTYEESLRKNRRRYNPDRPDSILEHGLSDDKMERLYREDDFAAFSAGDPHYLSVRGLRVPYVVFENHDDVTTGKPGQLAGRLAARLGSLWELYRALHGDRR